MIKHALCVRLEAKPGKRKELAQFPETGLGMAQQEATTPVWFALQLGPSLAQAPSIKRIDVLGAKLPG